MYFHAFTFLEQLIKGRVIILEEGPQCTFVCGIYFIISSFCRKKPVQRAIFEIGQYYVITYQHGLWYFFLSIKETSLKFARVCYHSVFKKPFYKCT